MTTGLHPDEKGFGWRGDQVAQGTAPQSARAHADLYRACAEDGMPQRAMASSRTPSGGVADDGGAVIRKDARLGRQVACGVPHGPRQGDDGGLALGVAVEVTH